MVITGRNVERGQKAVNEIEAAGGSAWFHAFDLTSTDSMHTLIADVAEKYGRIDVLVNNAAGMGMKDGRVDELTLEQFNAVVATDLGTIAYQGVFLQSSVQFALTSSKKNAIITPLSIITLLFRRRGVKTWPIGIIPWMTGSFRLPIQSFLLTVFRRPLCTKSPKNPASQRARSTQDTKTKTRCLPVCFRIFLKQ